MLPVIYLCCYILLYAIYNYIKYNNGSEHANDWN